MEEGRKKKRKVDQEAKLLCRLQIVDYSDRFILLISFLT
jgi:hypothetical protein